MASNSKRLKKYLINKQIRAYTVSDNTRPKFTMEDLIRAKNILDNQLLDYARRSSDNVMVAGQMADIIRQLPNPYTYHDDVFVVRYIDIPPISLTSLTSLYVTNDGDLKTEAELPKVATPKKLTFIKTQVGNELVWVPN